MSLNLWTNLLRNVKYTRISNNQSIRTDFFQLFKIFSHPMKILIMRKDIRCHIHLDITGMGKLNSFFHFFHGKVLRLCPQPECFAANIHGVCPENDRCL